MADKKEIEQFIDKLAGSNRASRRAFARRYKIPVLGGTTKPIIKPRDSRF